MIAFSMTPTAGSGLFGFFGRLVGTFIAAVLAYVMWYIVDGHTAGVIVFLYISISMGMCSFSRPERLPASDLEQGITSSSSTLGSCWRS